MNVQAIVVPTKYPNYVAVGGNIIKSDLAPVRRLRTQGRAQNEKF